MEIQKCTLIRKKIKISKYKRIILDENNKVIEDAILDTNKIKDINFNNLPSNVFDNFELYFGNEYSKLSINNIIHALIKGEIFLQDLENCRYNIESDFIVELMKYIKIKEQEEYI